jgi:cytochrome c2
MKKTIYFLGKMAMSVLLFSSCSSPGSSENKSAAREFGITSVSDSYIGPVNEELADRGKTIFSTKCIACHQMDARTVGPPLRGVTTRRTFGWIMNFLENPEEWVKRDPEAKKLFEEYNKIPMVIPGGITEEERKAVIEYLRREG